MTYYLTLADRAGTWAQREVESDADLFGAVVELVEDAPADKVLVACVDGDPLGFELSEVVESARQCGSALRTRTVDRTDTIEGWRDQAWRDAKRDAQVAADMADAIDRGDTRDGDMASARWSYLVFARECLTAALFWRDRLRREAAVAAEYAAHPERFREGRRG